LTDRDAILERYGWREGEREQVMARMAERERQILREAVVVEARRPDVLRVPVAEPPRVDEPAEQAPNATDAWVRWVRRQIDKRLAREAQVIADATAQVLAAERSRTAADIAALRRELADLTARLARIEQARSTVPLRAVE
jgi:hypothetical protein